MGRKRLKTEASTPTAIDFQSIDGVIEVIRAAKKIIVITGAGISVSCGIPDFRSKGVGLYHTLDCSSIEIPSAELLFDLEFFRIDPNPFYRFCKMLIPKPEIMPSTSHCFISTLEKKKKLLRNYTQNIDGLERKVGISHSKLIECHGSMSKFKCTRCPKKVSLEDVAEDIQSSRVLYCKCGSVLKPMITFFGEDVPSAFNKAIGIDASKCDLIIVIGTSLKVGGSVVSLLANTTHVPHILINKDMVTLPKAVGKDFDAILLGDCDSIADFISESLGWADDLKDIASSSLDSHLTSEKIGSTVYRISQLPSAMDVANSSLVAETGDARLSETLGKRTR
jgi:NAD+-dependent protein deacetylase sirtuin 1